MDYKKEAAVWTFIHYFATLTLSGVFMWNHHKVLNSYKDYANAESFVEYPFQLAYTEWYTSRVLDGSAFWFPDMIFVYALILAFPVIIYIMYKWWEDVAYLSYALTIPAILMAGTMICTLFLDVRLYLNALPTSPVCGCEPPSSRVALYDCHCIIPYHEGQARLLVEDPYHITESELKAGQVDLSMPFVGNTTVELFGPSSNKTLDDLKTWKTFEFSLEFVLIQAAIFVVLLRLRPYRLFVVHFLEIEEWSMFHSIIESHYYLLAESLDGISLVSEIVEHGEYFVNNNSLLKALSLSASFAVIQLSYGSFPMVKIGDKSRPKARVAALKLVVKFVMVLLVDVPFLGIRLYLVSLYGDEVKTDVVFILFIIKEIVMIILGVIEVISEAITFRTED